MEPNANITREQAFAVLARALWLEPATSANKPFEDEDEISDWARGEVLAMANAGYIQGSNGRLDPRSYITRAEFAQVMHNIFRQYINKAGEHSVVADGNILVNVPGVTLKNVTINGDLVVGDGVGEGDLVLDNVTIKGRLLVRGGGVNSIKIIGGGVEGEVVIAKVEGDMRICVENGAEVGIIVIVDGNGVVIIEGNVGTVIVKAPNVKVIIRNAAVSRLEVVCDGAADITVAESGKVTHLEAGVKAGGSTINVEGHVTSIETSAPNTAVSGTGTVGSVTVNEGADNTSVTTPNTVITNKGASNVTAGGGKTVPKYGSVTNNHDGSDILYPDTSTRYPDSGPVYMTVRSVSVSGIARVGETLTASATPLAATVDYQWQRSYSENGTYTDIGGAIGDAYILTGEDEGKWIRARATGTGNYMGTVVSEPIRIYGYGSGTTNDPFSIATADDLNEVRNSPDKCYIQIADIDLSGYGNWDPFPAFSGIFDGNGYAISNLKIDLAGTDHVGLFSQLNGGKLVNINLENVDVKGSVYVGGLVGYNEGTIEDSCVSGSVSGNSQVGGLVGFNNGTIIQAYTTGSVSANNGNAGGLVGRFQGGTISYCYAVGEVSPDGVLKIGGLCGDGSTNQIYFSYYYYDSSLPGHSNDNGRGEPRTSGQLKQGTADSEINGEMVYTGWDPSVWDFGDENDYPVLR